MDDLEKQRERHRATNQALNTPNCSRCLHPLAVTEVDGEARWQCQRCDIP